MHKKWKINDKIMFFAALLAAVIVIGLYLHTGNAGLEEDIVKPEVELSDWETESSRANGLPLTEDKNIYKEGVDAGIYDVYISVYPTKDETGKVLTFSDFALHTARNHDYNPELNCNIQIGKEGEKPELDLGGDNSNATIRVRGNSSRGDKYKSYKVKLSKDAEAFFGQRSLNINKHTEDDIKIVTKLCTDLLRDVPDISTYFTNFMRVWIRDMSLPAEQQEYVYQGLYTNTEQPNKTYLKRRGMAEECNMYKARNFSFQSSENLKNVDDPLYDERLFEQELGIREGKDHEKILQMIKDVEDESQPFEEVFARYFNEDNYLTWLAFSILTGGDDILNHNFILYSPVNSETWYFVPWDMDSNLQEEGSTYQMTPSLEAGQKLNMVPLHRRYFRSKDGLRKLEQKMRELLSDYMTEEKINSLLDSYMPVLDKTMTQMPDLGLTKYKPSELEDVIRRLPEMIQENFDKFQYAFQYPSPMFVSAPQKREDGGLTFSWEESYSYEQLPITYRVRVFSDYNMEHLLFEENNIDGTTLESSLSLDPGTYYLDVRAVDSEGREQLSLEHFEFSGNIFVYKDGLLEFTVE